MPLKLASNYASFFEKLVDMLERLADTLPMFKRVPACAVQCTHIATILQRIYVKVLEVFQMTAKIFTNGNGKVRKTPAVIGDVLWTPFDVRFKNVLDEIATQRTRLLDEISLLQLQQSAESEAKANEERKLADTERKLAEDARQKIEQIDASTSGLAYHLESQANGLYQLSQRTYSCH